MRDEVENVQAFQMQLGEDNLGGPIGFLKSSIYIRQKKNRGGLAPVGQVDLKNTGAFQKAIKAKISHGSIFFDSSDKKTPDLVEKYGTKIFGLNEESKSRLRDLMRPNIKFEIRRFIKQA